MSRLRGIVVAVLMLGAVAVPRAEAEHPEWTLTGSRTAYVDVVLDVPTALSDVAVTTRGRYAGVYVRQLTFRGSTTRPATAAGGWVAIRGLSSNAARLDPVRFGGIAQFQPGRIRVYLIADGPTTVRVHHNGRPVHQTFKPRDPATARVSLTRLAARDGVWSAALPVRVGARDATLAALQVNGARSVLADATVCFRAARATCATPPAQRFYSQQAGDSLAGPLDPERRWSVSAGGVAGDAVAEARVDPLEPLSHAVLAAFTLNPA